MTKKSPRKEAGECATRRNMNNVHERVPNGGMSEMKATASEDGADTGKDIERHESPDTKNSDAGRKTTKLKRRRGRAPKSLHLAAPTEAKEAAR